MTLEEEYRISCYEQLTKLSEEKEVYLVKNVENGKLYVKKKVSLYHKGIYESLLRVKLRNIPEIVFMVEEQDGLIVIEEYIHGRTLSEILKEDTVLDERRAIGIIINLLVILDGLHTMEPPIIHRDIKPQNIMLSNDGIVKLIDFNASRELEKYASQDTYLMGTVGYAAPEQYGFGQSDARTDLYACGVLLNVMLTGKIPKEFLYGGEIGRIIEKCTKLDQAERYQSAKELMEVMKKTIHSDRPMNERGTHREVTENSMDTDEKKVTAKRNSLNDYLPLQYREWIPVGFRTLVWWKCLIAFIAYSVIIRVSFFTPLQDKQGNRMTGAGLILNRLGVFTVLIGFIFYLGNYRGIKDKCKHVEGGKLINILLDLFYLVIIFVFVAIALAILEIIFI